LQKDVGQVCSCIKGNTLNKISPSSQTTKPKSLSSIVSAAYPRTVALMSGSSPRDEKKKKSSIPPPPQRPCPGGSDDGMGETITGPPGSSSTAEISPTVPLAASSSQGMITAPAESSPADDEVELSNDRIVGQQRLLKSNNAYLARYAILGRARKAARPALFEARAQACASS
jgi:hypothetical protein